MCVGVVGGECEGGGPQRRFKSVRRFDTSAAAGCSLVWRAKFTQQPRHSFAPKAIITFPFFPSSPSAGVRVHTKCTKHTRPIKRGITNGKKE